MAPKMAEQLSYTKSGGYDLNMWFDKYAIVNEIPEEFNTIGSLPKAYRDALSVAFENDEPADSHACKGK
jgi:hypothetical protein